MNLLSKIIFFLLIISFSNTSFSQDCRAKVFIQTDLDSAKLLINDKFIDHGKNFVAELSLGVHSIYIVENLWKWNSKSIKDTLYITDCSELNLTYYSHSTNLLDSDPQDAYIFKEDSLIGFTPLLLEQSSGEFILKKPDYQSKNISLQQISPGEKPELQFIGEERNESFYGSLWFNVLLGTAIALGATTAYYKLEADRSFDEYQVTGNPELLEQTDKYDVISGITFVALQIDFGLILYLFLSN